MAWLGPLMSYLGAGSAAAGAGAGAAATAAGAGTAAGAAGAASSSALGGILGMLGKGGNASGIPAIDTPGTPQTYSHLNPPQSPGGGNDDFIKMLNGLTQINRR